MEREIVMVRVPAELIQRLREKFPELREEGNSTLVRIALNKLIR